MAENQWVFFAPIWGVIAPFITSRRPPCRDDEITHEMAILSFNIMWNGVFLFIAQVAVPMMRAVRREIPMVNLQVQKELTS